MRERRGIVVVLGLASLNCAPGGGTDDTADAACGDGVVDAGEACDDDNTADGDGCSSACEIEYPQPECVTLLETQDAQLDSVLVTPDGRVLIAGSLTRSDGVAQAWVGAFDAQGQALWELEFPDRLFAGTLVQTEMGFAFLTDDLDVDVDVVRTDDLGNVVSTYTLADPDAGYVGPILEVDAGLLLAGMREGDLWLGNLSDDGQLSTLFQDDHIGMDERITRLRRSGDTIAAIGLVVVANHGNGDLIRFDVLDTWLLEFDEQGTEKRRTVFSSNDDMISTAASDLQLGPDGTWLLSGRKYGDNSQPPGTLGWATAVRDGEVLWTFEMGGSVEPVYDLPWSWFNVGAVSTDILLAGQTGSAEGVRRWAVRLDGQSGQLLDEIIGTPNEFARDAYIGGSALGERALVVGRTGTQDGIEQWLCDVPI